MSEITVQSNSVAKGMVDRLIEGFHYQLLSKEVAKKVPAETQQQVRQVTDGLIFTYNIPKPNVKRDAIMREDAMPYEPPMDTSLNNHVPTIKKDSLIFSQTAQNFSEMRRKQTSRFGSSSELSGRLKKEVKLNLADIKENKVIELVNRSQQSTAKSFRSVIQLDSQIRTMRTTYLKQLREQAKLRQSMSQVQPQKPKKIPKTFTFDFSGDILESRNNEKKGTINSPLKTKSISLGEITKKMRNPEEKEQDSCLEEELARAATGSRQKVKRIYNNSSKRQISHFPFISLVENTRLIEDKSVLLGPQSPKNDKTGLSSREPCTFTHYFQKEYANQRYPFETEDTEQIIFPRTFHQNPKSPKHQGFILKNSRLLSRSFQKSDSKELPRDYHPANVTRDHFIDQYYKIKQ